LAKYELERQIKRQVNGNNKTLLGDSNFC